MTLLLAIDTGGELCAACLYDAGAGAVLARADPCIGRGHAERLMDVLAAVLREAGASYADLGRIAVTVGPGSFTGIRVGVAAARGLSLALQIPAVGVTGLQALAKPHLARHGRVLSVLDAKRGEVYAELFAAESAASAGPRALKAESLAAFAAPVLRAGGLLAVVGSGAGIAAGRLGEEAVLVLGEDASPDIADVARIGARGAPLAPPQPLYFREADAKPQAAFALARWAGGDSSSP